MIKHFIFLRNDLSFNTGALFAQVSHVTVKCIHEFLDDPTTKQFMIDPNMTTVVLQIDDDELSELKLYLNDVKIGYSEWLEHPENVITALAIKPIVLEKNKELLEFIKKYKLFRK